MAGGCARYADVDTGHSFWPSRPNDQASPDCFANGRGKHRQGDHWGTHCAQTCHDSSLCGGSPTVFTNGRRQGRVGDAVCCGSQVMTGSPDIIIGP